MTLDQQMKAGWVPHPVVAQASCAYWSTQRDTAGVAQLDIDDVVKSILPRLLRGPKKDLDAVKRAYKIACDMRLERRKWLGYGN